MSTAPGHRPEQILGLGLDAGGSQARWALASATGVLLAQGQVAGFGGLDLLDPARLRLLQHTLAELGQQLQAHGRPQALCAGITGLAEDANALLQMRQLFAQALGLALESIECGSDMDIAYRAAFAPGEGVLLYAGTGAIAVHQDAQGQLQRSGGRGAVLGDAGGGYWIARQALAAVWQQEDELPGSWARSPLAKALFERIGGSSWAQTRAFVYGGDRGAMGRLALAVASVAEQDPQARDLLFKAGQELGQLALSLLHRVGESKPVAVAGRVLLLHPLVEQGLRAALPARLDLRLLDLQPQREAALRSAKWAAQLASAAH